MNVPTVDQAELLRLFSVYDTPPYMFLLGAGASFGAGIPTAVDITWILKRTIYCTEMGVDKDALKDLTLDRNRKLLQSYFDSKGGCPALGDDDEYSFYFGLCYPDSRARDAFIRRVIKQATPAIGHDCLVTLLSHGLCDWVWTTNFDDLIERAERPDAQKRLSVVGPESQSRLDRLLADGTRPVLVKLHGDYRYDSLQNTSEELQSLDAGLRQHLASIADGRALVVVGYSGRDESVMSALDEAAAAGRFQHGVYWCMREGEEPRPRVQSLIRSVRTASSSGGFVEIVGFDDLLYRLYKQCQVRDEQIESKAEALFERRKPFLLSKSKDVKGLPLQLNALRVQEYTTTAYRFRTSLTSWKEMRETVGDATIAAGLLRGYVYALGNRELIRSAFDGKMLGNIETADIAASDLARTDSVILGLLYRVIDHSLAHRYHLVSAGRHTFFLPASADQAQTNTLQFNYHGTNYEVPFAMRERAHIVCDAFTYQLEYHEGFLWFVLEPRVVVTTDGRSLADREQRTEINNLVMSNRYNAEAQKRLSAWLYYLSSVSKPISFAYSSEEQPAFRIVLARDYALSCKEARTAK